ncbi:CHAT domain-containing protein [Streptomyces sp. NPDC048663]|uniref:CHAT domain-containing protein n=1 Tax=Streptomyces sp. NPDC048663 TaxID=3155638 RepID=UPI00344539AC
MSGIRTAVDTTLLRSDAVWTPAVERWVADTGEGPESRPASAAGLLRASLPSATPRTRPGATWNSPTARSEYWTWPARHLPHAQLAVLLACHTTRTDRLPDEAVHLASAFQTAGYPQVVGALWEATDPVSVRLTELLYPALRTYGRGLDVTDTARAVHRIVRKLRAQHPGAPRVWAPYVHTGR